LVGSDGRGPRPDGRGPRLDGSGPRPRRGAARPDGSGPQPRRDLFESALWLEDPENALFSMYDLFESARRPSLAPHALSNRSLIASLAALPYRGVFGQPRPAALAALPLPPDPMPSHHALRPLKAWRYVGVFGQEVMLCAAAVRIGRARQSFWAVWDRREQRLHERTLLGQGPVRLTPGRVAVRDRGVQLELALDEGPGIEAVCPSGQSYAWTRKQGGVRARGVLTVDGKTRDIDGRGVIDDTAAYYERHTCWKWSAGVGVAVDGREVAWNLVSGVNDPPAGSERTVWIGGDQFEPPGSQFVPDLISVDELRFDAEAVRERADNLLLVRSRYRQPFGAFFGRLPGGIALAEGYGVMEEHQASW
jgi:Protein of unknown function (DUF2804)